MSAPLRLIFFGGILSIVIGLPELNITNSTCPTWYLKTANTTNETYGEDQECECGDLLGRVVRCDVNYTVYLLARHCMTYYEDNVNTSVTIAGACPYSSVNDKINQRFVKQPEELSKLNEFTCGRLHREGPLCSHCVDDYGVAVLSYRYECVKCIGFAGWNLFFALGLVPVTIFVILVIFCNFTAAAAHLNALICIVQILTYSINSSPDVYMGGAKGLEVIMFTVAGFFNLDFFSYIFPSFCISAHHSVFQVLAYQYMLSVYPFVLLTILNVFIQLHERKYRFAIVIGKPFSWCFTHVQMYHAENLDAKTSIINAFTTFIILGYNKIMFTSFALLSLTKIYKSNGEVLEENTTYYTLYNATEPYLGSNHKPYFVLAILMFFVFNILPVILLLLYPTWIFEKISGFSPKIRWKSFSIFMSSFQDCYKNRIENTWDHRYFAGIYLLFRLITYFPGIFNNLYMSIASVISPLIASLLFGILQPYKNDFFNRFDCMYFGYLAFGEFWVITGTFIASTQVNTLYVLSIPLLHILLLFGYNCIILFVPTRILDSTVAWIKARIERTNLFHFKENNRLLDRSNFEESVDFDDMMADRMQNPNDYLQPLLLSNSHKSHGSISQSPQNTIVNNSEY